MPFGGSLAPAATEKARGHHANAQRQVTPPGWRKAETRHRKICESPGLAQSRRKFQKSLQKGFRENTVGTEFLSQFCQVVP
eukprot:1821601-Amphidinium_carterae.1